MDEASSKCLLWYLRKDVPNTKRRPPAQDFFAARLTRASFIIKHVCSTDATEATAVTIRAIDTRSIFVYLRLAIRRDRRNLA